MREVDIPYVPGCGWRRVTADGLAEKSQLESVAMAVCGFQIPRVVPPFSLKVGVIEIVSREFESIAR
jgi:hypothetical protein